MLIKGKRMKLGSKIKICRENGGLTQIDLANLTGLSRSSIQLYEADKVEIPISNLQKIANALNLDINIFFENLSISRVNNLSISRQLVKNNAKNSALSLETTQSINIKVLNSTPLAAKTAILSGLECYETGEFITFSLNLFNSAVNSDNLQAIKINENAMTPLLYADSWAIFEACDSVSADGLYILAFGDTLTAKLLQRSPNGVLDIISTNKEFKSYRIDAGDETSIKIIGKVLRCII